MTTPDAREAAMTCSDCGMAPWRNHCCSCEPCIQQRIAQARSAASREAARMLREQPGRHGGCACVRCRTQIEDAELIEREAGR